MINLPAAQSAPAVKKPVPPPPPDYFPLRYKYSWQYESKTNAGVKTTFKITDIHDIRNSDVVEGSTDASPIHHELSTETGTMVGMMGVSIEENSVVSGPEEVAVPVGKFKAMKVVSQIKQGGAPATKTYWYGPNVGLVKSRTEGGTVVSDTELTAYQFPKLEKGEYEAELDSHSKK